MRLISAILFAVLFGFAGAYFAGPVGDWLLLQNSIETFRPTFDSPDQAAYFDLVVRLVITILFALVGMIFGILIGGRMQRRLIRQED